MKLFGKKDDAPTDAPDLDAPDDGSLSDAGMGDHAEAGEGPDAPAADGVEGPMGEGGELAAPARPTADGGNKKKLLIGLVSLVILGGLGGGGYFYFMSGSDVPSGHPIPPMNAAATPPAAAPAVAAVTPPAATPPAATPAAAAVPPGTPPMPVVATTPPGASAATAAATSPATPQGLGAPPADEATAIPLNPAGTPPGAMAAAPSTLSPPGFVPAPTGALAKTPAAAMAAPAIEAPGEEPPADLPMPASANPVAPVAAPAGTAAATTTAATATAAAEASKTDGKGKTAAAAVKGKGTGEPSDAEKAIVQNAAVLDQLSTNTTPGAPTRPFDPNQAPPDQTNALKTVDQLLEQPAIVRPMPPSWLTVKKERASDDVDTRLTVAREALAQNNNTAALQLFTELKIKYPKDHRILMGRAVALQKLGQEDAALGAYEDVLNGDPRNLEALTNMLGLLKRKDPNLALEKLQQLRETYPYNPDITAQLGIAYAAAGRYEDALKYLDMAEALNPGSMSVMYNKAVLYDKMGQNQRAGDLYREVIRQSSEGAPDQSLPLDAIKRRLAVLR